jgi:hypothetical protein
MMTRTGSLAIVMVNSANAGLKAVKAQPKNVNTVMAALDVFKRLTKPQQLDFCDKLLPAEIIFPILLP